MSAHNDKIHWVPENVGSKRFGNWVADARDWNISRNRFWGTPIPLWHCKSCEDYQCVGSVEELEQYTRSQVKDLHPHKIDHLEITCKKCSTPMHRISDVFDCLIVKPLKVYERLKVKTFDGSNVQTLNRLHL